MNPFGDFSATFTNPTGPVRSCHVADSPACIFNRVQGGKLLERIDGAIEFRAAVASTSVAAPNAIVVHADIKWQANFPGTVATSGPAGIYTPNGASTTGDNALTLIAPATNGQDAGVAGFDTFEPRFNAGRDHI